MAILVVDFVARLVTTQTVTGFALPVVQLVCMRDLSLTGSQAEPDRCKEPGSKPL